jgi:hypothetical protein
MKGAMTFATLEEAKLAIAQWRKQMRGYWEDKVCHLVQSGDAATSV